MIVCLFREDRCWGVVHGEVVGLQSCDWGVEALRIDDADTDTCARVLAHGLCGIARLRGEYLVCSRRAGELRKAEPGGTFEHFTHSLTCSRRLRAWVFAYLLPYRLARAQCCCCAMYSGRAKQSRGKQKSRQDETEKIEMNDAHGIDKSFFGRDKKYRMTRVSVSMPVHTSA